MEVDRYVLPEKPAGSDKLVMELHHEQNFGSDSKQALSKRLLSFVPEGKQIKALILGARCGLTAQILIPACSHLDLVEEEPFATLLKERFCKGRDVSYFFGKEGWIGQRCLAPKPKIGQTQVRVILDSNVGNQLHEAYDLIVLQNCLINQKVNLVKQLLKIEHEAFITMLVPGYIFTKAFFPFVVQLQKNILRSFYQVVFHEQIQAKKAITGRRNQIIYYQVYGWRKKSNEKETKAQIHQILEEAEKHTQWKNQQNQSNNQNPYETQNLVDVYMGFHYGEDSLGVENYPAACSKLCIEKAKQHYVKGRALDLGCSVGRTTIELAEYFQEVVGLDFSKAFIKAAQQVLADNYEQISHRVNFVVGDACKLDQSLGKFNLIFGGNLIDRLPEPEAFLNSVGNFLEQNGILILTSPYSWLEEYTPKQKWIGGYIENGVEVTTNEGLKKHLTKQGFKELCPGEKLLFSIKDNDFVYQYTTAEATFWQKL